ncbi:MAG: serine hydroxymethyltransferase [Proteobacteria bacterium]|nr:serine hydroxymethyltransferase [Pseudomonadota bacterium]MCP4919427.1 serine hydroxymethyltransferase [Pseudomonadota bacterium]
MSQLRTADPELWAAIEGETRRQATDIELIASENYVSAAVLEALGSPLTNKYAEGLPNRRYYGGCEEVDKAENLARSRAKELFGSIGANVQPHSGATANAAVYLAALQAGDTILGLDLSNGGHLTHGSPVNMSGKIYNAVHYTLDPVTGRIDMDSVRELARRHSPKMIVTGASAYARFWDWEAFRSIADEVGALLFADIAHVAGLVVTGHHPSPIPHCDYVSTTTHKTLRGPRGGLVMGTKATMRGLNSAVFPGTQGGPLMHCVAAKAVAFREAQSPAFAAYSAQVVDNAAAMAGRLVERGLSLVSGGTDNHLMLIDLGADGLSGKEAEDALARVAITTNKNTVPGETRSPFVTSGLRIGTPAMTTRGMDVEASLQVADWIADVLASPEDEATIARVAGGVKAWCAVNPVPQVHIDWRERR